MPAVSQRGQRDHQIAALALWLRAQRAWQAQQLKPRITRTGWLLGAAEGLILAGLRAYAEDVVGILVYLRGRHRPVRPRRIERSGGPRYWAWHWSGCCPSAWRASRTIPLWRPWPRS